MAEAEAEAEVWSNLLNSDQMGWRQSLLGRICTGHGDGTGVLLGNPVGALVIGDRNRSASWVDPAGVFLGGGTGCSLEGLVLEVAHGGGFPLGVVDPGPPIDASRGFGVLASWPGLGWGVLPVGLEIALNMSAFWKSSLK